MPVSQRVRIVALVHYRVTVEGGPAALEKLIPAWEALGAHAIEPNPACEHWMMLPALRLLGEGDEVLVCVWRGDELSAILPARRVQRYKGLPVPALAAWRSRHFLLGTPLVHSDGAVECLAALVSWLGSSGNASVLQLDHINASGPFYMAL